MNKILIQNYCLNLELEEHILTVKLVPIKHVLCFSFFVLLSFCNDELYYSSGFLSVFWSFYNIPFSLGPVINYLEIPAYRLLLWYQAIFHLCREKYFV